MRSHGPIDMKCHLHAAGIVSLAFAAVLLSGCNEQASTSRWILEPSDAPNVQRGSIQQVGLLLDAADEGAVHTIQVAVSDPAVAEVYPATCTLASVSEQSRRCLLTLHGKNVGATTLSVLGDNLPSLRIPVTVGSATNYGKLAVEARPGAFETTSTTIKVLSTGSAPYAVSLKARVLGSSGLGVDEGVVIRFTGPVGVSFNPSQCAVTSRAPECETVASLPQAAPSTLFVSASGAQYQGYETVAVDIAPQAGAPNGTISLSTQAGNGVPNGMRAPLFVNWTQPATADTLSITLTLQGTGISFYSYAAGNNTAPTLSPTQTCQLKYAGPGQSTNVLNCGLGLVGAADIGQVTATATVTSTAGQSYSVGSLVLGAIAPAAAVRTVTFNNSSSETVFVGITGGAANAYLNASTPAIPPGQVTANLKAGAASQCGPSNPQAACPVGTTCMQGGAAPSSNIGNTPFYCYYDAPTPSKGYAVAPNASTSINVSGSSISPNGVIWSGNFYPRSGCDPSTGQCENATCVGAAGGLACGPGTGPSPGINTLAELTFQAPSQPDFYDVSIINGANFATQFGPVSPGPSSTNAYSCGTAGSGTAQNGGYGNPAAFGLPAASWTMAPSPQSFPPGASINGDASSYYRVVIVPSSGSPTACTQQANCADPVYNTCGYPMSGIVQGGFAFSTRQCGRPVAWATANAIWGANSSPSNLAPFGFGNSWPNGLSGAAAGTVSVSDLQLCINQTYSAYIANGTAASPVQPVVLACGGAMWGATQAGLPIGNPAGNVGLGITTPTQPVITANSQWLDYVLPTIQWLKQACPTCYTYPFDDMSSTFTCTNTTSASATDYSVDFSDLK